MLHIRKTPSCNEARAFREDESCEHFGLSLRGTASTRIRIRIAVVGGSHAPGGVCQSRIPSDMSALDLGL